jgi:hypothetical protein
MKNWHNFYLSSQIWVYEAKGEIYKIELEGIIKQKSK